MGFKPNVLLLVVELQYHLNINEVTSQLVMVLVYSCSHYCE
jgi:hypothetical protein